MLYIDSCSLRDIDAAFEMGVVGGVTTNPILANKAGVRYDAEFVREVLSISNGPVHVQLPPEFLTNPDTALWDVPERVVFKIPCTFEGLALAQKLEGEGYRTNITAVMSVSQAILAVESGASYVSMFWGRITDAGLAPYNQVCDARGIIKHKARIIVGSIREAGQVSDALAAGAHIVTASLPILKSMLENEMTTKTVADFDVAWEKNSCRQ